MSASETKFNVGDRVQVKASRGGGVGTVKTINMTLSFAGASSIDAARRDVSYNVAMDGYDKILFTIKEDDLELFVEPPAGLPDRPRVARVLMDLDLNAMSPMTALTTLHELKRQLQEGSLQ